MSSYRISRSTSIAADPALVHRLVTDFHEWPQWSPWEGLDPEMERHHTGASAGVGAHYAWAGNRKAGAGSMEITTSTPERIEIALVFDRPFKSTSDIAFLLVPAGGGTDVTWEMAGEQKGLAALFGRIVSMDRLVGKDFERGLAQLKSTAEA
jgi:uncharacterized protein YndB with AHSA1/START domain